MVSDRLPAIVISVFTVEPLQLPNVPFTYADARWEKKKETVKEIAK